MDLVKVDKDKCVNCHRCIAVCPIMYCNDGSGDGNVSIITERCIYCGNCIDACKHGARYYEDDFKDFISKSHKEIAFLVAPSVVGSWGSNYKRMITFLRRQLKASKVYDASFGAELTVMKYVEYIEREKPKTVIAQPCPVIVKYIENYKPELLKYLAPIDSPVMAMARYLREVQGYKGEIAFLSPCIGKAYEFKDRNTKGYINYNLTFQMIRNYMKNKKLSLETFEAGRFDDFEAERGVALSRPGGLKASLERDLGAEVRIKQIEGHLVYDEYFDELEKMLLEDKETPLVVDVLSCEKGCNYGPGTLKALPQDEVDYVINQRVEEQKKKMGNIAHFRGKFKKLQKSLRNNPFKREYDRKLVNFDESIITPELLAEVYRDMNKTEPRDFKDCGACGHLTCEKMAKVIIAGLNRKDNCYFYVVDNLKEHKAALSGLLEEIIEAIKLIGDKLLSVKMIFAEINNSFAITHDTLNNVNKSNIGLLTLSKEFTPIVEAITEISDLTHLLSLNAAIEAARAGAAGKGFAIVAHEVDKLSSQTSSEVEKITPMVKELINRINKINDRGERVIEDLDTVKDSYLVFVETIGGLSTIIDGLKKKTRTVQDMI